MYEWHPALDISAEKEVVIIDPVSIQIENFLITVFCGLLVGLLFDGYRVLRGILNPKTLFTDVGDLIFWVVSTMVVFTALLLTNWGEVRVYVFLGLIIGFSVYVKLLSRHITYVLIKTWRVSGMMYRWIAKLIYTILWQPALWLIGIITLPFFWIYRNPCRYLINRSHAMGKRYKDAVIKRWFTPKDPPETP